MCACQCSRPLQINKCLKSLEQRKLIKAVKSVASSNRKVYMLFELEPSREITGGAWYVAVAACVARRELTRPPAGTRATSTTASSSTCCGKSATSTSSARRGPRWVRRALARLASLALADGVSAKQT